MGGEKKKKGGGEESSTLKLFVLKASNEKKGILARIIDSQASGIREGEIKRQAYGKKGGESLSLLRGLARKRKRDFHRLSLS